MVYNQSTADSQVTQSSMPGDTIPPRPPRLDEIPGVNRTTIENVVAEIGVDMSVFPDEHHLSSWAGICPGNEASAGKRLRNRTTRKNRWLRRALVEAGWAAGRTKQSYLGAQYRRLAARRGKKRALVAVGHSLLVIFYHMLNSDVEYQDLGVEHFDHLDPERLRRYLVSCSGEAWLPGDPKDARGSGVRSHISCLPARENSHRPGEQGLVRAPRPTPEGFSEQFDYWPNCWTPIPSPNSLSPDNPCSETGCWEKWP